jgi:hypothetical protein
MENTIEMKATKGRQVRWKKHWSAGFWSEFLLFDAKNRY